MEYRCRHRPGPKICGISMGAALTLYLSVLAAGCGDRQKTPSEAKPQPASEAQAAEGQAAADAPNAPPPSPASAADANVPKIDEPQAGQVDAIAVEQALKSLINRQECNRVTGCPALDTLAGLEAAALEPTLELLKRTPAIAPHYTLLVEAIGRLGHHGLPAATKLRQIAENDKFMARIPAIVAIGRIGDTASRAWLKEILQKEGSEGGPDTASLIAARYALHRLGEPNQPGPAGLAFSAEYVRTSNWGFSALAVPLLVEMSAAEALPGLREAARHTDFFLRRAAVQALERLGSEEDAPLLLGLLEDRMPSVRNAALRALNAVAREQFPSPDAARKWARANGIKPDTRLPSVPEAER